MEEEPKQYNFEGVVFGVDPIKNTVQWASRNGRAYSANEFDVDLMDKAGRFEKQLKHAKERREGKI